MSEHVSGSIDPQRLAQEIDELEYLNDVMAMRLARYETANEEMVPGWVVDRLHLGDVPVRVWREFRGLSAADLAAAAGVSESDLAGIEARRHEPGLPTMARIAKALRVDLDDLVAWAQEDQQTS